MAVGCRSAARAGRSADRAPSSRLSLTARQPRTSRFCTLPMMACPTVTDLNMLDANVLVSAVTRKRRRTSTCIAKALSKRAAADPNAATRRSVAKPLSNLARINIAAVWQQAIWTVSAPSSSSAGAAASIIARAALIWVSEIVPKGARAAACSWSRETFAKSLDVVAESFIQPLPPVFGLAVRRMDFCQLAIRPPHFDTDRRKAALGGATCR